MSKTIKSSISAAQEAVSEYVNPVSTNKMTTFKESNLSGMTNAMNISNEIVGEFLKLYSLVKTQAAMFPEIASVFEELDVQIATSIFDGTETSGR